MYMVQALASDPGFVRVSKGLYTLRALAPVVERAAVLPTKPKGQRTTRPPPPRFDPSAFPEPAAPPPATDDGQGADDNATVPVDFLDGSSVLAPLPADADPYQDMLIEEEYLEDEDLEAVSNVRAPLAVPADHAAFWMLAPTNSRHFWLSRIDC